METYTVFNKEYGLYDGPIDGWFCVYHRSILPLLSRTPDLHYFGLGSWVKVQLRTTGLHGLLSDQMKVFHVTGPGYASAFEMLEFEIEKYQALGRFDLVKWYENARKNSPAREALLKRVREIQSKIGDHEPARLQK